MIIGPVQQRTEENFRSMVTLTKQLCIAGSQAGIQIAMEPEPDTLIHNSADLQNLLEAAGMENLKLNLDIGHAYLTEEDLISDIYRWNQVIVHTHLEDINQGNHRHLIPGDGEIPFGEVFEVFDKIGYAGSFTIDLFDILSDPRYYAREAYQRLRERAM